MVEHDGSHLISHSQEPLFTREETQAIIDEAEERAARMGGWTTKRHANYATTDVPVQELPRTHTWFREKALPEALYPFLATSYKICCRRRNRCESWTRLWSNTTPLPGNPS